MRKSINPDTLVASFTFLRNSKNRNRIVVYLESDSDINLFSTLFNIRNYLAFNADGKENVTKTIEKLNQTKQKKFLGIVDSDFDNLLGKEYRDNLLRTDTHDIETEVIFTDSNFSPLQKIIISLMDPLKVSDGEQSVLNSILVISYHIGTVKYFSMKKSLGIDFKNIQIDNYFDINHHYLADKFESDYLGDRVSEYKSFIDIENISNLSNLNFKEQICNGHDIIKISCYLLQNKIGRLGAEIQIKIIEENLRIQYEQKVFMKTKLYNSLIEWEENNNAKIIADNFQFI